MEDTSEVLLSDLLALVQQDLTLNGRAYSRNFGSQIKPILRHFNGIPAVSIRYQDVEGYKAARVEDGAALATINHELGAILRAYRVGRDSEVVDREPKVRRFSVQNAREGFVDVDQLEAVLSRLPPDVRDFAEFAYWTGWRRGEVQSLCWDAVDRQFVYCVAVKSKTRHSKKAALVGAVREVIDRRREKRVEACRHVFHRRGKPMGDFRHAWIRAVAGAGMPDLRLHDFRRSFVRNAVRAGIPERIAMELSGHRTRGIFDRYNIVDEKDLREAGERLAEWGQSLSCS